MSTETIIALVTGLSTTLITILGLYYKDRADQRRWQEATGRSTARHEQNTSKLDKIENEVNGKMQQLVNTTHVAAYQQGKAEASVPALITVVTGVTGDSKGEA